MEVTDEAVIIRSKKLLMICLYAVAVSLGPEFRCFALEFPGLTNRGPSGGVLVPTGQVVSANNYTIGLHRGVVKAGYGLFDLAEFGFALPDVYDAPNRKEWADGTTGFMKVGGRLYPDFSWFPGLAVGAENSLNRSAETYYMTASWHGNLLWWPVEGTIGAGTGRFENHAFAGAAIIPAGFFGRTLKFFGEYAGKQADVGARIALSKNLRLDFAMLMDAYRSEQDGKKKWTIHLDHGIVGASRADRVDWNSIFKSGKKAKD